MAPAAPADYGQRKGVLTIRVVEAKGLDDNQHTFAKGNPYAKIMIYPQTHETPRSKGGGAAPKWDAKLPPMQVNNIDADLLSIEILDKRRVGTASISIAQSFSAQVQDNWYPVAPKGQIRLRTQLQIGSAATAAPSRPVAAAPVMASAMPPTAPVMATAMPASAPPMAATAMQGVAVAAAVPAVAGTAYAQQQYGQQAQYVQPQQQQYGQPQQAQYAQQAQYVQQQQQQQQYAQQAQYVQQPQYAAPQPVIVQAHGGYGGGRRYGGYREERRYGGRRRRHHGGGDAAAIGGAVVGGALLGALLFN